MRVLIIEDDEGLAELERSIAEGLGFKADASLDGASALEALRGAAAPPCECSGLRGSSYDLALLDYSLPDAKADGLMEKAQAEGLAFPPFIVTTGLGDECVAVAMMRLGARDYIVKDSVFLEALPQALVRVRRELETENCLAETRRALEESERLYRLIAENASDAIFLYDPLGKRFKFVSPSLSRLYGLPDSEIGKHRLSDFIRPGERPGLERDLGERISKVLAGAERRSTTMYRTTVDRPSREPLRFEVLTTLFLNDRGELELIGVGRNVEERARMEEAISKSLAEKEILLKEIHHRVNNNLQIVSSLINLQKEAIDDRRAAEALVDSQNRIQAMALIHEQLYRSPDLADIDFGDYVRRLVPSLIQDFPRPVEVAYELSDDSLPLDSAIPCGLILSELVSNSIKHAFPATKEPRLSVAFGRDPAGYRFVVADNGPGIGFDDGKDAGRAAKQGKRPKSLGLTLVASLVEQLGGSFEANVHAGSRFGITFPIRS